MNDGLNRSVPSVEVLNAEQKIALITYVKSRATTIIDRVLMRHPEVMNKSSKTFIESILAAGMISQAKALGEKVNGGVVIDRGDLSDEECANCIEVTMELAGDFAQDMNKELSGEDSWGGETMDACSDLITETLAYGVDQFTQDIINRNISNSGVSANGTSYSIVGALSPEDKDKFEKDELTSPNRGFRIILPTCREVSYYKKAAETQLLGVLRSGRCIVPVKLLDNTECFVIFSESVNSNESKAVTEFFDNMLMGK